MSNSLMLANPQGAIDEVVTWLKELFSQHHKTSAVIAVSGGIDSALAVTLLSRALGPEHVFPLLLPYGQQDMTDGQAICDFNRIPPENVRTIDIQPIVDATWQSIAQPEPAADLRRGNLMARSRMLVVFDRAKALNALVCGTENKSEHWLGYWTRFGDAASDIEPLSHLYKTQVRQLAEVLGLPAQFLTKAPSAGLWAGQTDELEMGFSYADADLVLAATVDRWPTLAEVPADVVVEGMSAEVVAKVLQQVRAMHFKLEVPYEFHP